MVPTFAFDGHRMGSYPLRTIERWVRMGLAYRQVDRRGRLCSITFYPHDGSRIRKSARMGQRYSRQRRVSESETRKAWEFEPLFNPRHFPELAGATGHEIDLFVRAVFRAVPLSCMRREPEPPPPVSSKVVSIASARVKRKPLSVNANERRAA